MIKIKTMAFLFSSFLFLVSFPLLAETSEYPIADAGDDIIVSLGEMAILKSRSFSPMNRPLQYQWSMVSSVEGSKAELIDSTSDSPSFFADKVGNFVVRLRVSDGIFISEYDDVIVRVVKNQRPIAIVNGDQTVRPGQAAVLDASSSFDLENSELKFQWSIDVAPVGSDAYIFHPVMAKTSFIPDIKGIYLLRVSVSDSMLVDRAYVVVRVEGEIALPPISNPGEDFFAPTGEIVMLDGSGSSDQQNLVLTYSWRLENSPTGSSAIIQNSTSKTPSFTPDLDGEYQVSLQVSNGNLTSRPSFITVTTEQRPVAHIDTRGLVVGAGSTVILNALKSVAPDEGDLSYEWTLQRPTGGQGVLSSSTNAITAFNADIIGTYTVSLRVQSEHLYSKFIQRNVIVGADKEQKVVAGSLSTLDGSVFEALDLNWDIISRPDGSRARIFKNQNTTAVFEADVTGSYIIRWSFWEGGEEYWDYSLVHAYSPQGVVIFGPQSLNESQWQCLRNLDIRGCSDKLWNFTVVDVAKNYALIVDYSDIGPNFIYLNGMETAGHYDFLSDRSRFIKQVSVLESNELKVSFAEGSRATLKIQEMSFSGTEKSPPMLTVADINVVQGESASAQVSLTDAGSTKHSYSVLEQAAHGSFQINAQGNIRYTADATYQGPDFVIIKVENENDLEQLAKVIITVSGQSNTESKEGDMQ